MPEEVYDVDEFLKISERANFCEVKRLKDVVKLKLRTSRKLYTLKTDPAKAEGIVKKLKCEIVEV